MPEIPLGNLRKHLTMAYTVILSGQLSQDTLHHCTFPMQPHESVE